MKKIKFQHDLIKKVLTAERKYRLTSTIKTVLINMSIRLMERWDRLIDFPCSHMI